MTLGSPGYRTLPEGWLTSDSYVVYRNAPLVTTIQSLGSWRSSGGTWRPVDNGLASGDAYASAVADAPSADYTAKLRVRSTSTGTNNWDVTRAVFRMADGANYYSLIPSKNGVLELAKMQDGRWYSWLASAVTGLSPMTDQQFEIRVSGPKIEVSVNGVKRITYSDPDPILSGGVGAMNGANAGTFGGFSIQAIIPGGPIALNWKYRNGSWAQSGGRLTSSGTYSAAVADVPTANYSLSATVQTTTAGAATWNVTRLMFRAQDADNYYALVVNTNGTLELAKRQNGKWVSWLAGTQAGLDPRRSNRFDMTVFGNRIMVSVNGKLLINFVDTNPIRQGGVGVMNDASAGFAEGFVVTRL